MSNHAPRVRARRGPARFKQGDVVRAIKEAEATGRPIGAIVISPAGEVSIQYRESTPERAEPTATLIHPPQFTTGYVYFISADELPFIKVGYAGSPLSRVRDLQVGNPYLLKIVAAFMGNVEDEDALHALLARYRGLGEWFRKAPPVLALIESLQAQCGAAPVAAHLRGRKPL
jgi:hypothetical protein